MEETETVTWMTLADLPDELLLSVLTCRGVTVHDLCSVACTCSRLRNITLTQNLWRQKIQQQWPKIWDFYPSKSGITNRWPKIWDFYPSKSGITDWQEEVKQIICFDREIKKLVAGLSRRLYQKTHLTTPVYNEVDAMVISTPYAPLYMKNALGKIIDKGATYDNLTHKYYALKVMSHVHQGMCRREWQEFLEQPPSEQSLEVGTMMLARWFQPHVDVSIKQMSAKLDDIAETCRIKLRATMPDHPAVVSPLVPAREVLSDSKWNQARCEQLLKCINYVLFDQLKFSGNSEDYYSLKNSLINEVLSSRKGIPISLSIVYMSVCHRLGIYLEPVNFPSHFLVKWKIPGTTQFKYIDAFDKGRHFTCKEVLAEVPQLTHQDEGVLFRVGALAVFQRMVRNIMNVAQMQANISDHMELYCPATELMSLLTPSDHNVQELLLRIYYTLEIHYDRIVAGCQELLKESQSTILDEMLSDCQQILQSETNTTKPILPNPRSTQITFATGLVMKHKLYDYSCVIFGWDKDCKMPGDWVRRMGVDTLQYKCNQPFYNVLVHDGSHRYAAEENLSIAEHPIAISHSDIGKYFKEFTGTHYVPNDELEQQYPEDEAARNYFLRVRGFL